METKNDLLTQKVEINLYNEYWQKINKLSKLKNTSKDKIFNSILFRKFR